MQFLYCLVFFLFVSSLIRLFFNFFREIIYLGLIFFLFFILTWILGGEEVTKDFYVFEKNTGKEYASFKNAFDFCFFYILMIGNYILKKIFIIGNNLKNLVFDLSFSYFKNL